MKKKIWRRFLAVICVVSLLVTVPSVTVLADDVMTEETDNLGIEDCSLEDGSIEGRETESNKEDLNESFYKGTERDIDAPEKSYAVEVEKALIEPDDSLSDDLHNDMQENSVEGDTEQEIFGSEDKPQEEIIGATSHNRDEAVAWANSQKGKSFDYDGKYGAQCVDFIYYYYIYLGQAAPGGSAYQFVNGGRYTPSGWSYQSSPVPGDIAVWTGGQYGHVAIVTEVSGSRMLCVEQNYLNKQYVTANYHNIDAQKYIRPDFSPIPVNVTFTPWYNDNYTYIRQTDASLGQEITVSGGTCTSTGMYLYDSNGSYLAQGSNPDYTLARVYFMINAECGYTLSSGTTYKYKFYAIVNGQTYWSNEYSFETLPDEGAEMSHGYDAVLPNGDYAIVSAADAAYYLDIEGTAVPATGGTNVSLCGPNAGHLPSYEIWNIQYNDGFYTIRQKDTDVCLDVTGASRNSKANIQMCSSNGSSAQKWAVSCFDDGRGYRLQAKCSGFSLDITGASITSGTNVWQHLNNNSDAQRWLFIPYEPERTIADGRYILVSALNPRLVLDISGDTASVSNGTNVQVWNDGASSRYNSIDVKYLDHGYYRLNHAASGKSVEVENSRPVSGTNISLYTEADQNNQKWAITKRGDGYVIWSRCSGLVMDVWNGDAVDGTNIWQHYFNGSNAQIWKFVQAEYKVTYNANGGTGAPSAQTKYYANALTLSSTKPVFSNRIFMGWATSKNATTANYQPGASYTGNKDLTLYAVWSYTPVTGVSISASSAALKVGGTKQLTATVSPMDATNKSVTWTSSNESVAKVGTNGLVTAVAAGTADITVTTQDGGKKAVCSVTVSRIKLSGASVTGGSANYTGSKITPTITVTHSGKTLVKGTDYTISPSTVTDVGTYTITVKGKGAYTGTRTAEFTVNDIPEGIVMMYVKFSYRDCYASTRSDGVGGNIATTLMTDSNSTSNALRFQISKVSDNYCRIDSYKSGLPLAVNGTNVQLASWTGADDQLWSLVGNGNGWLIKNKKTGKLLDVEGGSANALTNIDVAKSNGQVYQTWYLELAKANVNSFSVSGLNRDFPYTGSAIEPQPVVFLRDTVLVKGVDYTLQYKDNVKPGEAVCIINGCGNYTGSQQRSFTITENKDIGKASVGGISLSYGYTGKAYTPKFTVKLNGVILKNGTDYTYVFKNNKNPGTATLTITGKGEYTGTRIKTFEIVDCVSSLVSGGTYQLIPKNNSSTAVSSYSGKMLNNTKVYITDRSASEAMRFKAIQNADGTWKFINAKCELALAVQKNSSAVGAGIVLYDQTSKAAQNWKLSKKSDNSFAIMNAVTGFSIAMSDESAVKGTTLSMAETASSGLQRFYIAETSEVDASFDGTYSIRASKDTKFALNIASSSTEEGANVNLYTYSNTNAKKFKALYSGAGYYRLVNMNSGLVLSVEGNTKKDGTNVIQSTWQAQSGQRWKITENPDGTVTFTNALGTTLFLVGNKTANGTNIAAGTTSTSEAQKWYLQ